MGLFDTVRCEHPRPPAAAAATDFQTKSLACEMAHYVLTTEGRLLRADGSDTGFHGVLRLHGGLPGGLGVRLEAKFTDGKLVHIVEAAAAQYDEFGLRPPAQADP